MSVGKGTKTGNFDVEDAVMRSLLNKIASCAFAAALALGLVPTSAFATDTSYQVNRSAQVGAQALPSVEEGPIVSISDGARSADTAVFVDVVSGFELIEMSGEPTHLISGEGVQAILDATAGSLFATVSGWAGNVSATWTVNGAVYEALEDVGSDGTFNGRFLLPLSAGEAQGALRLEAPGFYECVFSATDSSKATVTGTVWIEVLAPGQTSDYADKTVYPVHDQTIHDGTTDGAPETFAEPSLTGSIHKNVVHVSAVDISQTTNAQAWGHLQELAARANSTNPPHLVSAYSLATLFDRPTQGSPAPYRGELSVVLPVPQNAGIVAGQSVYVVGYDERGDKQAFLCNVRADETGALYVSFSTQESEGLGVFGIAVRATEDERALTVEASVQGSGFINYEGTYRFPARETIRYIFTPVAGWRLAQVTSDVDALVPPETATTLGYWDVDLSRVPSDRDTVSIVAVFEPIPEGPGTEDPAVKHTLTVEVEDSATCPGEVYINEVQASPTHRFEFGATDTIELRAQPTTPSQSVASATIQIGQGEPVPLALYDMRAFIYGIADDAHIVVRFSKEIAPPVATHQVTLDVVGGQAGHGSIDTTWADGGATTHVVRTVADGASAIFNLFPEPGYGIYTVMDGTIEIGSWLNRGEGSGFELRIPDIHRDHTIEVEFRRTEELPDVVPPESYVTIQTESVVQAGSTQARPAIVTPPSVVIPAQTGYSFYVIPANDQGALASVHVKGTDELSWHDITDTVAASWVEWPNRPEGSTSTGYYELTLDAVAQDTFVRVVFRDRTADDPVHDPTPTRKVTINVKHEDGASGTVSPNTVGKPPLVVPVGAKVQVVVICDDGSWGYVDRTAPVRTGQDASADETGDVRTEVKLDQSKPDDAFGDGDTFEIPDSDEDQDITITFRPTKPNGSSSSSSSSSASSSAGSSAGSSTGSSAGSSGGNTGSGVITVVPVLVPGQDGKVHGSVSPATPVQVHRGDSVGFTFQAEMGYRVELSVGSRVLTTNAGASYTLANVQTDTELRIAFVQRTAEDGLSATERPVHRLTSLARTGDLVAPLVLACATLAAAAAGIALLAAARRRKKADGTECS